jgi:DNA mismatch endonuclease (patch repair protein)
MLKLYMDILDKTQRSFNMSQIKSKNTQIELKLRKLLWKNGLKNFRIHTKIIGKPDIYFPVKKLAIFIDGCFWHKCPIHFIEPKSNIEFWMTKIKYNQLRDARVNLLLIEKGIKVLRYWEHELKNDIDHIIDEIKFNL